MRLIAAIILWATAACQAAEWRPQDIHPKVFQMIDCWLSDTAAPVVTEINLDAVRENRNQFGYSAVKTESGWITYREGRETLRFKLISSVNGEHLVEYHENAGGTLTTKRLIRFTLTHRTIEVDKQQKHIPVLRLLSIASRSPRRRPVKGPSGFV